MPDFPSRSEAVTSCAVVPMDETTPMVEAPQDKEPQDDDEAPQDEDDAWELAEILAAVKILGPKAASCQTDGCGLKAAVAYVCLGSPNDKWLSCIDCQVRLFKVSWLLRAWRGFPLHLSFTHY